MIGSLMFSGTVIFFLTLSLIIVNYAFKAAGLYTMAVKQGLKQKWRAFVPFASDHLFGQLTGGVVMFMSRIKNSGLMLMLVHIAVFIVDVAYNVLYLLPNIQDYLAGGITFAQLFDLTGIEPSGTVGIWITALSVFSGIFNIGYVLLFVSVCFSFFRKFTPRNYMLYSLLSVFFGLDGIFIFVVRKNPPINIEQINRQRQYYDPYNPYNPGPGGGQGGNAAKPDDPFSEFPDKNQNKGDPFDEFFNGGGGDKKDDDIFH